MPCLRAQCIDQLSEHSLAWPNHHRPAASLGRPRVLPHLRNPHRESCQGSQFCSPGCEGGATKQACKGAVAPDASRSGQAHGSRLLCQGRG